jgi:uncharacterized phage protein gp47/JayE
LSVSNVPAISWSTTGVSLPSTPAVLTGVLADWNYAFNGNLNTALNTPQGQLASSQAYSITKSNANWPFLISMIDPATSQGIYQDAIGRLYFMTRNPAQPTTVQCLCVGVSGTSIPIGAQVKDTSGNIYSCVTAGEIPVGGSITLEFANIVSGPIACAANTVTTIYQSIQGWDTVNNVAAGITGNAVESQFDFEYRRQNSVTINAQSTPQSVAAAILSVANVTDVFVYENTTGSAITYGATTTPIKAHSIYIAVTGGLSTSIANAIITKKGCGCDYNANISGSVTVSVPDTSYNPPYPLYSVIYNVPAATQVYFSVSIANNPNLPSNIAQLIQSSIISAFNGQDGGTKARIGSTIYAVGRYASGIMAINPLVELLSITVGLTSLPTTSYVTMGIDQQPVTQSSNITVNLV